MIYFVRAEETGHVKIGYATNVRRRLSQLRVGSPLRLTLMREIEGTPKDEAALHEHYADLRVSGEWFRFCESMEFITAPARDRVTYPPYEAEPYRLCHPAWLIADLEFPAKDQFAGIADALGISHLRVIQMANSREPMPAFIVGALIERTKGCLQRHHLRPDLYAADQPRCDYRVVELADGRRVHYQRFPLAPLMRAAA